MDWRSNVAKKVGFVFVAFIGSGAEGIESGGGPRPGARVEVIERGPEVKGRGADVIERGAEVIKWAGAVIGWVAAQVLGGSVKVTEGDAEAL